MRYPLDNRRSIIKRQQHIRIVPDSINYPNKFEGVMLMMIEQVDGF
jgi:hypothetical protein